MLRSAYITKKLYVSPVVSFETMEDDERMLMMSGTAGHQKPGGTIEKPGGDEDLAKRSDFIFDESPAEGFEYQIDGLN